MEFLEELKWRGLIKDTTDAEMLQELLDKKATLYCGFDPTAPSLHIGHLVPVIMLSRFQKAGHRIVALVGGGTGLIGDPSGRSSARKLLTLEDALANAEGLKSQLSRFLDFSDTKKTVLINNYEWLKDINVISFLRDYGRHFPVNYMLAKDTVASRLETGISFTEFSYMIIQSIDFYNLYKRENCRIQLGGSDQWGNITSGVELIRRITGDTETVGITMPLITKSDGTKFGKSAGGALWLDADKTSPYAIYQYFLNSADADVIHYLKVFTFLNKEEIYALEQEVRENPQNRVAQKKLAYELVKTIHGGAAADEAVKMSQVLFSGKIAELTADQLLVCLIGVPSLDLTEEKPLVDVLVEIKAASSKREAREFVKNGSVLINGEKQTNIEHVLSKNDAIDNKVIVIRRGKKNYYMVRV